MGETGECEQLAVTGLGSLSLGWVSGLVSLL